VRQKHVLILGGTGRVGSSTAAALLRSEPDLRITLAGRNRKTYEAAMKRRPELACCEVYPLLMYAPTHLCTQGGQAYCLTVVVLEGVGHSILVATSAKVDQSVKDRMLKPARGFAAQFASIDIDNAAQLAAALRGTDLLLHCAGPFQRKETCAVLEACLEQGTPYMDVCDDTDYSARARTYHERAQAAGVPAITTAGAPFPAGRLADT
jgi:saccharopine dehydrogenase-like NADP-dependent oxidoreductase